MPGVPADPIEDQPQQEIVAITREMKQWAHEILDTMNTIVASHGVEPSDELMALLGRMAFGALGSRIPAATWCHYGAVIAGSGFGADQHSRSPLNCRAALTPAAR